MIEMTEQKEVAQPKTTISVNEFAKELGLEPNEQGRLTFTSEHVDPAYDYGQRFNKEGRVVVDGVASPAVLASLMHGAHPAEAHVPYQGKEIQILEPMPKGEGSGPLEWSATKTEDYTLVEFSIPGGSFEMEDLSKVIPPEVDPDKPVFLSGRGPGALTHSIAAGYRHFKGVPAVGFYQPESRFGPARTEIGISHDESYPLGLTFGEPSEVGSAQEKHKAEIVENLGNMKGKLEELGLEVDVEETNLTIKFEDGNSFALRVKGAKLQPSESSE